MTTRMAFTMGARWHRYASSKALGLLLHTGRDSTPEKRKKHKLDVCSKSEFLIVRFSSPCPYQYGPEASVTYRHRKDVDDVVWIVYAASLNHLIQAGMRSSPWDPCSAAPGIAMTAANCSGYNAQNLARPAPFSSYKILEPGCKYIINAANAKRSRIALKLRTASGANTKLRLRPLGRNFNLLAAPFSTSSVPSMPMSIVVLSLHS